MLLNMHIKNLALIDSLDINFDEGLNILTGETGAGKSIIIGSIGIGLGGKFSKELLRDENKDGIVELLFSVPDSLIPKLKELDIFIEEGEDLIVTRKISNGRTINRINDNTVTVAKIREVSELLINLHAQHEQQTLLKASKHLEIVDSFDTSIAPVLSEVKKLYQEYTRLSEKLEALKKDEAERLKRLDFVKYQLDEIEAARLTVGEDEELEELYNKIKNSREIVSIAQETYEVTGYDENNSAGNQIGRIVNYFRTITNYDKAAEGLYSQLMDIEALLNDFNRELSDYMSSMEFDPELFRETEDRLNLVNNLKGKYGRTIEEVLSSLDDFKTEYEELTNYDDIVATLEKDIKKAYELLVKKSDELSKLRQKSANELCKLVEEALHDLNMTDVTFRMAFEKTAYGSNGCDNAIFMIRTNIGEAEKPLNEVVSGGELSRVMLAIKSCLAGSFDTPTLVFDEVDVGISGITAQKVAKMMHKLSRERQILSITHLPQIASFADSNYLIRKEVVDGKTMTGIEKLSEEGAIMEIARLLGGENITDNVLSSAKEMKELALNTKKA